MQIEINDKLIVSLKKHYQKSGLKFPKTEELIAKEINSLLDGAIYDIQHLKDVENNLGEVDYNIV